MTYSELGWRICPQFCGRVPQKQQGVHGPAIIGSVAPGILRDGNERYLGIRQSSSHLIIGAVKKSPEELYVELGTGSLQRSSRHSPSVTGVAAVGETSSVGIVHKVFTYAVHIHGSGNASVGVKQRVAGCVYQSVHVRTEPGLRTNAYHIEIPVPVVVYDILTFV